MRMVRLSATRFFVTVLTCIAFTAAQIPTAAFAQNSAQAEVLFKEGQQLIADKKFAEACQRLAASFKLDPQPNTELLQGLCYSKLGKTASAYNAFIDAASMLPKGGDAQKYAADQARALEAQLLKVRVKFQPVIPPGMQMHFDEETKTRDKDFADIDIALDPGEHDLFVTAPGKHDYTKHFKLDASSPHDLIVNMTDKTKEELAQEKGGGGGGGGQVIVEKPETSWSTVKTVGMIGIIVGGAAVVGAVVTQILAFVFQSNATTQQSKDPGCVTLSPPPPPDTDPNDGSATCNGAVSYHQQALAAQTAAIGIGIAGGAILLAGIIMFVAGGTVTKAPEKAQPAAKIRFAPWIGPQTAGMGLVGTF
jgi:tetratricopeptide (TPR) repeat protein